MEHICSNCDMPPKHTAPVTPLNVPRPSNEDLLATSLNALTELRYEFSVHPDIDLSSPQMVKAIASAAERGFSIRELAAWFRDNGVSVSVTQLFRIAKARGSARTEPEFFVEAFRRIDQAIRWMDVRGLELDHDTTVVFVHGILGSSGHPDAALMDTPELFKVPPAQVRHAAKHTCEQFLKAVKTDGELLTGEMRHYEVLHELAKASDEEIMGILAVAQSVYRRPVASQKLRERKPGGVTNLLRGSD